MRIALVAVVTACTSSSSVVCEDGFLCAEGKQCAVVVTTDNQMVDYCVDPTQLDACAGLAEGAACATGTCHGGACLGDACGNSLLDATEVCDHGDQLAGNGCSADCRSNETCGNQTIDVVTGELCDDGPDHVGHDGCASDCSLESARWIEQLAGRPSPRGFTRLVYDAHRRRSMVFGGGTGLNVFSGTYYDTTFEWDGQRWYRSEAPGAPSPRGFHAAAYDGKRHEVVLFGGSSFNDDTWTWDGEHWTARDPATHPTPLLLATMAYDAHRDQMVLFGGIEVTADGTIMQASPTTWLWNGETWVDAAPATSPSPRAQAAMAYDPKRGVVVLFGGEDTSGALADLWEWDGTTWTKKTFATGPTKRVGAVMAFDAVTNRMLIAGGGLPGQGFQLVDAWEWDGTTFTAVANLPALLGPGTAASDSVRGRVVVFGAVGSLYEFNGALWSTPAEGSSPAIEPAPAPRQSHAAVLDPIRREMVMTGGSSDHDATTALGDAWTWNGVWRQQSTAPVPARWGSAITYDAKRDVTLLFGGCTHSNPAPRCDLERQDTWQWKNHVWTALAPQTLPPARAFATMQYDPIRERVVMFGGTSGSGAELDDTYTWDGLNWHLEAPATKPPKREKGAMGFDWITKQVVLFGGRDEALDKGYNDTWLWDGTTWTDANPTSTPSARAQAQLAWDDSRGRLELVGGLLVFNGALIQSVMETWEWDGTRWLTQPTDLTGLDAGRYAHTAVAAMDGDGVIVFGGSTAVAGSLAFPEQNEVWRRDLRGIGRYETCADVDSDGDGLVGCADPDCAWACAPRCPQGTSCTAAPTCGDGGCDGGTELCDTCPQDCGACPARCGNFTCDAGETAATCPGDCP